MAAKEPKSSKAITRKSLAEKVESALVSKGEVNIEVRGLSFQELTYAKSKARAAAPKDEKGIPLDSAAVEIAMREWYLRFGVTKVQGNAIPREVIDIGVCKLEAIPIAALESLYTYPDIAEALFLGIVDKTHNTEDELDGLDFTSLFTVQSSSAPGTEAASVAKA